MDLSTFREPESSSAFSTEGCSEQAVGLGDPKSPKAYDKVDSLIQETDHSRFSKDQVWSWLWFLRKHRRIAIGIGCGLLLTAMVATALITLLRSPWRQGGQSPAGHPKFVKTGTALFPSTLSDRLHTMPIGPQTSWYRAITFSDPDLKLETLFEAQEERHFAASNSTREQRIGSIQAKLAEKYKLKPEERKQDDIRIRELADEWQSISKEYTKLLEEANLLPRVEDVPVESEFGYVVPLKSTAAFKSWPSLEALRTTRHWPEEAVLSAGFEESDDRRQDYRSLMLLVRVLHLEYLNIVPDGANLKLILFDPEGGPWSSRLYGIKAIKSTVVTLIDNDDYMYPDTIALKAEVFRQVPDLDYLLSGYDWLDFHTFAKNNETRSSVLSEGYIKDLTRHMKRYHKGFEDESVFSKDVKLFAKDYAKGLDSTAYADSRKQFEVSRRVGFYLGSIWGMPNLGVQWYRYHKQPYKDLLNSLRQRISKLQLQKKLPPNPLDLLMGEEDGAYKKRLRLERETKDESYLDGEIEAKKQDWDKRCHNGWSTGRREVYENIPPPIYQWQGEDANYNFMVYQSGLNGACITSWGPGIYTSWTGDGAPLMTIDPRH